MGCGASLHTLGKCFKGSRVSTPTINARSAGGIAMTAPAPSINLQVNVSGGRTSAYMAWWLKMNMSHKYNFLFIFANTGQEHEETLRYVNDVDKNFHLDLVWVEAQVHHNEVKRSSHKVVDYASASRN